MSYGYDPYGYRPGYADPLSGGGFGRPSFGGAPGGATFQPHQPLGVGAALRGEPMPGMGRPMAVGSGGLPLTSAGQNAVNTARRSVGSFLRDGLDWVKQPENLNNAVNIAATGLNYLGAREDRSLWKEQMERERELEDQERERIRGLGPIFSELARGHRGG